MEVSIELGGNKFSEVSGDKGEADEIALAALFEVVSAVQSHGAKGGDAVSYMAEDILLGFEGKVEKVERCARSRDVSLVARLGGSHDGRMQ